MIELKLSQETTDIPVQVEVRRYHETNIRDRDKKALVAAMSACIYVMRRKQGLIGTIKEER